MTLLPVDSRDVEPRLDLDEYDLNTVCASPSCTRAGLENHHLWRRSFGKGFREAWWVELLGGVIAPNRVGLCLECHKDVTENRVRILYDDAQDRFLWVELADVGPLEGEPRASHPLFPQPGPHGALGRTSVGTETSGAMQLTVEGGEVPHEDVVHDHSGEKPCPRCKGKGVVPEQEQKPETTSEERPKVTFGIRVPKDEREDGHALLEERFDIAIEKCHDAGLIRDVNKGATYYTACFALDYFNEGFDPNGVEESISPTTEED